MKSIFFKMLRIAFLALLGGTIALIAIVLLGSLFQDIKSKRIRWEFKQRSEQLFTDPVAVRLRNENEERCAPKEREFYWMCGAVVQAKPTIPYGYCTTAERPLYIGSLGSVSQEPALGELSFFQAIVVGDLGLTPTNATTPDFYPNAFPPLGLQAGEPDFSQEEGQLKRSWVVHGDLTVLFVKGSQDWSLTPQERAELPIRVIFKHPDYPISVSQSIPLESFEKWSTYVDDAVSDIAAAVVSFDPSRNCSDPPSNVRYSFAKYNDRKIEALRDWLRDHSDP